MQLHPELVEAKAREALAPDGPMAASGTWGVCPSRCQFTVKTLSIQGRYGEVRVTTQGCADITPPCDDDFTFEIEEANPQPKERPYAERNLASWMPIKLKPRHPHPVPGQPPPLADPGACDVARKLKASGKTSDPSYEKSRQDCERLSGKL